MAAQTLILQNPALLLCPRISRSPIPTAVPRHFSKPRTAFFQPIPTPRRSFSIRNPKVKAAIRASSSPAVIHAESPPPSLLSGSIRTVTTLLVIALAASKRFAGKILNFAKPLTQSLISSSGPAFFAAVGDYTAGSLNTPFTVVAAGMAKWLDIYSGVLMIRVLLSWFPNIPWDRQPFSAIRDLCDPYLNLFRNIIPPIFDTLDVSPLLAFAVLGTLGSILKSSKGGF